MLTQRKFLYSIAAALAAVTIVCLVDSLQWIGRPFMGFLLGRNRIVAPIGLSHWTGFRADVPFGAELVEVGGHPVDSVPALVEEVWRMRVGTPLRYAFATPRGRVERTVEVMRFSFGDYLALFGVWLFNGILFLVLGLLVARLKPGRPASAAMLVFSAAWGLTLLLSLGDFYRFHFRSLYAVAQAVTPAALVVLALTCPDRALPRRGGWLLGVLAALTALHAALDIVLYDRAPRAWMTFFEASLVYMAAAALLACGLLMAWYRHAAVDGRTRVKVIGIGALIAFGAPAVVHLAAVVGGVTLPVNLLAVTTAIFPLVVAYAVVKHDLLDLDPLLTRSVFYAVLTTGATAGYLLLPGLASALGPTPAEIESPWVPFLFTLGMVAVVAPLRRAVQTTIDRFFFRTRYDAEAIVEEVSRTLAASLDRETILAEIRRTLDATMAPAPCFILLPDGDGLLRDESGIAVAADDALFAAAPGPGANILPLRPDTTAAAALGAAEVNLVVPLRVEQHLEGLLALGPKRSTAPYGGRDLGLLRTLANQAAIALRNAASYSAVRELTATLEERVAERTQDLARTHEALLETRGHLARADKLASLGRLVAGVAHEINNPVAFINASVDLIHEGGLRLRQRLDGAADPKLTETLEQLLQNAVICRDGAARAARIVRELTAFSRASEDRREPTDIHAGLERTLQLLRGEYRDRIKIVREYEDVPRPLCNPGQIDQVFMNLLTNAVQAIRGEGEIRVRTHAEKGSVFIEVSDTGCGIAPDVQGCIFEPFFTTKATGEGTGLGLAIAHSLVARHEGDISLRSAPGEGATFTVRLPLNDAATFAEAS